MSTKVVVYSKTTTLQGAFFMHSVIWDSNTESIPCKSMSENEGSMRDNQLFY